MYCTCIGLTNPAFHALLARNTAGELIPLACQQTGGLRQVHSVRGIGATPTSTISAAYNSIGANRSPRDAWDSFGCGKRRTLCNARHRVGGDRTGRLDFHDGNLRGKLDNCGGAWFDACFTIRLSAAARPADANGTLCSR